VTLAGVAGGCGWSGMTVAKNVLMGKMQYDTINYSLFRWCTNGLPYLDRLPEILDGKYIVLLLNNRELRPAGGFMGSFARVEFEKGNLVGIRVVDIYEPDGKLVGHVEPPYPVQESFLTGEWRLRDSDWDVDFKSAALTIKWFLEQGGEKGVRGIVAVNLLSVNQLIGIFGELEVPEYGVTVNEDNLYALAQEKAESGWFAGSMQKGDFLGALSMAMLRKIEKISPSNALGASLLIYNELKDGQILVWFEDAELQKEVEKRGWAGRLEGGEGGFLYVVETNLGANKANCCIERVVEQDIENNMVKLKIEWENKNEFDDPKPPKYWGGRYWNYVRVIVPKRLKIQDVRVQGKSLRRAGEEDFEMPNSLRQTRSLDMYNVEERDNFGIVGFWAYVQSKSLAVAELELQGDGVTEQRKMLVKRQPGIERFRYQLTVDGRRIADEDITADKIFSW